ncbi:hypothetical protein [Tepidiforma sp.]|uniref:endonuclease III domain-containing protein n=1 Tax=Tepidiforma sp. TaxID=2682230 RepID=UPI002ADD3325|nr:hypothetical protein [Tepidiforma sp.]
MTVTVAGVVAALERMHGHRPWHWWPPASPFEICLGAILVQRTTWTNAERALDALRARGLLDPEALARLSAAELEDALRPAGQFRQKARKVRAFLATCEAAGGFDRLLALPAPELRERLLATWGIGPETADCIVCYAAGDEALVIDAYTARLFRRLGMGPLRDGYDAWQQWLRGELERQFASAGRARAFGRVHALIVLHAKHLCRARNPDCGACELRPRCRFAAGILRNEEDPAAAGSS